MFLADIDIMVVAFSVSHIHMCSLTLIYYILTHCYIYSHTHTGDDDGLEELGITMDDLALVQDTVGTATTPTAATGGITSAAADAVDAEAVGDSEDCS